MKYITTNEDEKNFKKFEVFTRYQATNDVVHMIKRSFVFILNKAKLFLGLVCSCITVVFCLGVAKGESIDLYLENLRK